MKKSLALLLVALLGIGLSVGVFANTEDELVVELSTEDIGHMEVAEDSVEIEIEQSDLAKGRRYLVFNNVFCLGVNAISDWKVNVSGTKCENTGTPSDPALLGALIVEDMTGDYFRVSNSDNKVAWGSNNMNDTYSRCHNLKVDLYQLGDQVAGSNSQTQSGSWIFTDIAQWTLSFTLVDTTPDYNPPGA